jgi:tetratricopeptide (TPR) repeat protein
VKIIYDQVHTSFLQKYEPVIRFAEVFKTGNYNCVTATALYALVFEKLKIPYAIQEKPTHVFLVAYPKQNNILVETTTPVFGYLTYDTRYKQNFIDNLKAQKLIGSTEVQTQGIEELFNKYYFQSEDITLAQLVGIHYMNDALFYEDRKDLDNALTQCEKAYLFYPSLRMKYLLMHFVVQILATTQPKPLERATLIGRAARFSKLGITPDMIKGEFAMLTETVLTRDNNKPLYRQCYEIIDQQIDDPELKKDIGYYYHFEIGRQYYNQGAYTPAKNYFAKGMEFQPHNAELGSIFIASLANSLRNEKRAKVLLDTLNSYQERFPNLNDNNKFLSLMAIGYLMAYEEAMRDGKATAGEGYQQKFESLKTSNPDVDAPQSLVGSAYSAAGTYYFRKGQKAKARAIIDRGLEFAPGEYQLRQRKQMIN